MLPIDIKIRDPSPEALKQGAVLLLLLVAVAVTVVFAIYLILYCFLIDFAAVYSAVVDFAKLTGDYVSLSATDLRVIALTLMLEKENGGAGNINLAPRPV